MHSFIRLTYIELKDRSCRREMVILSCVIYKRLYSL